MIISLTGVGLCHVSVAVPQTLLPVYLLHLSINMFFTEPVGRVDSLLLQFGQMR